MIKAILSFFSSLLLLLSACDTTDTSASFPTDARDFMIAGNPGTELTYSNIESNIDTNGVETITRNDTVTWTVMNRTSPHPSGGQSVLIKQNHTLKYAYPTDSTYLSFRNSGIAYYESFKDHDPEWALVTPLTVGSQWIRIKSPTTVKSVGEIVNTTFKPLKAVRLEFGYSSDSTQGYFVTDLQTHYYAPELFLVRRDYLTKETFANKKTRIHRNVYDLIRYTKK